MQNFATYDVKYNRANIVEMMLHYVADCWREIAWHDNACHAKRTVAECVTLNFGLNRAGRKIQRSVIYASVYNGKSPPALNVLIFLAHCGAFQFQKSLLYVTEN